MPSGLVTIRFENATGEIALAQLARLNPGTAMADLESAVQADDQAAFYSWPPGSTCCLASAGSSRLCIRCVWSSPGLAHGRHRAPTATW